MQKLEKKVILITGSTRGFGYSIAEELLKSGARVIITGRSQGAIESAINALQALGQVRGELCDVTDESQVHQLAKSVVKNEGQIDIWINNAGYSSAAGRILDMDPQEGLEMFQANSLGTMYGSQAAYKNNAKMLVNIFGAGSNGKASSPMGLYAASKAWAASFTRTMAKEMKEGEMQIVGFNPGMMMTDMLKRPTVVGEAGKEMMRNYGFVLRFLAGKPEDAAAKLVKVLIKAKTPFVEYRVMKPWTPFRGLIRVLWGNITKTGERPEFEIDFKDKYE
ncbi:MAG: SDR family oxidoreductase [Chloroflexi bacterium]|nr:SDR family oxidoreductase [Chloroflexota bacterium]